MFIGAGEILSTLIYSFITSIFAYVVLKLLNEHRNFFQVFIVVLISNFVTMLLPFSLSLLQIPLLGYSYLIISIIISLFIYKYGLTLSWLHTIALVILTPIIAFILGIIFSFIGLGTLVPQL